MASYIDDLDTNQASVANALADRASRLMRQSAVRLGAAASTIPKCLGSDKRRLSAPGAAAENGLR